MEYNTKEIATIAGKEISDIENKISDKDIELLMKKIKGAKKYLLLVRDVHF